MDICSFSHHSEILLENPFDNICTLNFSYSTNTTTAAPILETVPIPQTTPEKQDRFNYASFDCGAVIRAGNAEASSLTSILLNSKDAYMLNPCSASKFVEIELCQDILVDHITLANFEFFSSMFKDLKVFGSSKWPPDWMQLGAFTAANTRKKQDFTIKDPSLWTKFLRIDFQTHYGSEFYCPLTLVQVFGTTMMEEMKTLDLEEAPPLPIPIPIPDDIENNVAEVNETKTESPSETDAVFTFPAKKESLVCFREDESVESITTPTPLIKSESSVFTKMHARISQLERLVQALEQNGQKFTDKQLSILLSREETLMAKYEQRLRDIDLKLEKHLVDFDDRKIQADVHLASVSELLDELKVQLSWSQFWNHVMLFLGALSIKIVNDRVGILGFWLPDRKVDNDDNEDLILNHQPSLENSKQPQRRYHQKKKRKFKKVT